VNYGDVPRRYAEDADSYFEGKGFKLELLAQAIRSRIDIVDRYQAIWLPDDDLEIEVSAANHLFELFRSLNLVMAQPALIGDNVNHPVTRRDPRYRFRYTTFVEMMCPIFTRESLFEVLDTFERTRSGWGIDCLWAKRFLDRRVAILDEVAVRHLKPQSNDGAYYRKLLAEGVEAIPEMNEILRTRVTPGREWPGGIHMVDFLKRERVVNVHEALGGERRRRYAVLLEKLGFGCRVARKPSGTPPGPAGEAVRV
jgi:hypothetical protein